MTALPSGPYEPTARESPHYPRLVGERILVGYRSNDAYAAVLPALIEKLREHGVDIDLVSVPQGSGIESCKGALTAALNRRTYTLCLLDGTMRDALATARPAVLSAEIGSLDQIVTFAASGIVWRQFGICLTSSPDEVPMQDEGIRYERFKSRVAEGVRDLFKLVLQRHVPDRVWIFTEDLRDHLPFYHLAKHGENPGIFLRDCFVEIGYPVERLVVVNSREELVTFTESDEGPDPLLELIASPYAVMIGDRHRLHEEFFIETACHSLGFRAPDLEQMKKDIAQSLKEGQDDGTTDGLDELALIVQRAPILGALPEAPLDFALIRETLAAFGVAMARKADSLYRRVWLRFPIENFAPDLAMAGCLDEESILLAEDASGSVRIQLVDTLDSMIRVREARTSLRLASLHETDQGK